MAIDRLRHIVRLRLRSLFFGAAVDRELDEELRYHRDRQVETFVAQGMTREQARTAALLAIGGVEQRKEACRDARGVSLALGIGANTAIFQLLNALSLRTLPVRAPHELVEIRLTGEGRDGRHNGRNRQVSLPQYRAIAERQQAFSSMLAFGDTRFNLN